jgi:LuxR family maltose regulon positive regulatory protein
MAEKETIIPILNTKLHRPALGSDHVHRTRLLDRLNKRLYRPLTLVSAPAGYGKTTLMTCWLESCDLPSAWVSLDENDNDLRMFLAYFLSAVQSMFPDAAREIRAMLNSPELPELRTLALSLINELDQIENNFILVLDDYHVIHDKAVQDLVIELLKHPPAPMHLVLTARRDPSMPLTKLRAWSHMTEIRVQDLLFSAEETVMFLQGMLDIQVDRATAFVLKEKTEGWITGLRLAALSLRNRSDLDRIIANLPEENHFVTDYLFTEVLLSQPEDIHEYLLATAILNRFCVPLCDAVCVPGTRSWECKIGGRQFIKWLKDSDLFMVPLDDQGRWFRYHRLFQQLLQDRLKNKFSPDDIANLYKRAGTWFGENGLIEEALDYALKGGDTETAIRMATQHRHDLMNQERWDQLRRIMNLLPHNALESVPELILLDAWMQWHQMQIAEMIKRLDRVEPRLTSVDSESTTTEELKGECNIMRGLQYYLGAPFDAQKVLDQAQQAMQRVPRHRTSQRGLAIILLALAYQATGSLNRAHSLVFDAINEKKFHNTTYHGRLLMTLGFIHWLEADLTALKEIGQQMLNVVNKYDLPEAYSIARYFLGISHYCRNELVSAEKELTPIVMAANKVSIFNFSHSAIALSMTYQAQGRPTEASNVAEMLVSYSLETNNPPVLQIGHAFQAELALRQRNIAKASRWASEFDPEPFRTTNRFFLPQPLLVKVRLAQNTPESLQQAAGLLSRLQDFYTSIHNRRFLIDVLLLQALLHDARGEESEALSVIERTITLAEPGGFIRPFVDLGPKMAGLLNRLVKQKFAVKYVGRLLAAFRKEGTGNLGTAADEQTVASLSSSETFLNETLTNREIDILTLLAQRLSNKEIAEKLFLSPKTVKAHLYNIYQKLNVSTRRQAVEKANALSLLPNK